MIRESPPLARAQASSAVAAPRTAMAPLLLGASVVFWGWQTNLLWLAIPLCAVMEGARLLRTRWDFAQADLDRIWNLCLLLFFGSLVAAFANSDGVTALSSLMQNQSLATRSEAFNKGARSVILVFEWLPLVFLPILLAQVYGTQERMDWSTFSPWLRRQRAHDRPAHADSGLNVCWLYYACCLLAASAANERGPRFTIGLAILASGALWTQRPRQRSPLAWALCWLAALGLGLAAQTGLQEMQRLVQRFDAALVARLGGGGSFNDKETHTLLGSIGRLKLSGAIVLRVETDGQPPPRLLREASYNAFRSPYWAVHPKPDYHQVNPETNITTTVLLPRRAASRAVTISRYFSADERLLALPIGTVQLEELPANLETNAMGVVRLAGEQFPGFARYDALYQDGQSIDTNPSSEDLDIPVGEKLTLAEVARELHLSSQSPEERIQTLARFFSDRFRYSIWQGPEHRPGPNQTPLSRFLLRTRSGHCEHFATATTLLLRQAGTPARYAVGYSVQEKNGNRWLVRDRHAHAWCLAFIGNAWRDVNLTPASWSAAEELRAPWWESISDFFSEGWYRFSRWRWSLGDWKQYLIWLLLPLLGLVTWRLVSQKQWRRTRAGTSGSTQTMPRLGLDSEFFQVEKALAAAGLERLPDETPQAWLRRLVTQGNPALNHAGPLLTLHYRHRFDPQGLSPEQRAQLRDGVRAWLRDRPGTPARH